jgi:hypothetical protein
MLTAREFVMHEPLPRHGVQEVIFEFCRSHCALAAEPLISDDDADDGY